MIILIILGEEYKLWSSPLCSLYIHIQNRTQGYKFNGLIISRLGEKPSQAPAWTSCIDISNESMGGRSSTSQGIDVCGYNTDWRSSRQGNHGPSSAVYSQQPQYTRIYSFILERQVIQCKQV
jgi:hypothetical protein